MSSKLNSEVRLSYVECQYWLGAVGLQQQYYVLRPGSLLSTNNNIIQVKEKPATFEVLTRNFAIPLALHVRKNVSVEY